MEMTNFEDISAYIGLDGSGTPSKNYMGWTNTLQRANPFPIEMYSVFPSFAEASAYAAGAGKYTGLPYEGQIIAVTDTDLSGNPLQKVYVLDSTMANGLRQLAAGDDASSIQNELNAEISARKEADDFLSNVISTDISNAITAEVDARETDVAALSNAISTEVEARTSADEYLSTNLSISLEEDTTISSVLKSYTLKQGTRTVGTIDIPKDFLVKSATVETVTSADVPYAGAQVGDKYIDLEINVKSGTSEDSHIYIPIKDFFVPYKAGVTNTISVDIGSDNTISAIVIDGSIGTAQLSSKAVTTEKIADGAVGTTQLSDDAVTNDKIADNAVGTAQLSADAVTNDKIAADAVGIEQLSASAVTTAKIADGNVTEGKIADDAVTNAKIADDAVGTDQLSASAVTTIKIADEAVTTAKIDDGAVTTAKIENDAVTNDKIADNAVDTAQLSASAVTTAKIADSAVTTDKINNGAVTTDKINDVAVTNGKIADSAVDTSKLSASAVTTEKIADSAVTTAKINDSAVTTGKINDLAVTSAKIADGAVTNEKLGLSSVTMANLSSDVVDYIQSVAQDNTEYVDNKVSAISGDWSSDASKTVVSVAQREGVVTLSAVDIAIEASQVTDLADVVGNYVPLSVANDATSSDKLQKESDVTTAINTAISALDVEETTIAASKTITKIGEVDGKISVETGDIAISASQVVDLDTVVGAYVPLSVASSSASDSDKLQTASEVQTAIDTAISALDVDATTIAASKTITQISETDGKISVVTGDIQIAQSQVTDLTTDLNAITSDISALSDDVAGLESDKLDKSEFAALSNEIGLSAATSANPVVTKQDIANLAGAMHFKGAITDLSTVTSADPGDVVIIIETSKEYVYNGVAGEAYLSTKWVELGDEDLYATKGDLETVSATLAGRDTYISGVVDTLSTDMNAADSYLSGAIDNKIYVDGAQAESLSAFHISQDDFYAKVVAGTILSNELYVVSSDYINAYGEQIKNVAEPTLSDDAATKNYVDTAIAGEASDLSELSGKVGTLSTDLGTVSSDLATVSTDLGTVSSDLATVSTDLGTLSSNALTGVVLNGESFTVADNVATLSIEIINCGTASA